MKAFWLGIHVGGVIIRDGIDPTIKLIGESLEFLLEGSSYLDLGAEAKDYHGKDISNQIVQTNDINNNSQGDYTVTYTIVDKYSEVSQITRTVRVVDASLGFDYDLSESGFDLI